MNKVWYFLLFAISGLTVFAQSKQNYRNVGTRKILINDTTFYDLNVPATPIIIGDSILQLFCGEKYFVEVDVSKNILSNYKVVEQINNKDKTIVIEFKQVSTGKEHEQMILTIFNPFKNDLYYSSNIYLLKNKKWVVTNVEPVKPKGTSYEAWPDIITSISIHSLRFKK